MLVVISPVLNSILYSFLGIAILVVAFVVVELITPKHNLWKEVVEKQNMALAIVAGLSIAIIIASAVH